MKTAALLAVVAAATAVPAIATEVAEGLPVNRWTLLPEATSGPASYNGLVYAPELGRVIRWRWSPSAGQGPVEAFDAAKGEWIPEGSSVSFPQEADEKRRRLLTVSNGCSWDSKRGEVVYTMAGRMVAYHPGTREWRDLGPRTVLDGWDSPAVLADHFYEGAALVLAAEESGPPPCYGLGTCYDPIHDEILLFPHFGAANLDRIAVDGTIGGHLGTMVFSYGDNTWRRASHTFGTDEVQSARRALFGLIGRVSRATDAAWALHRGDGAATPDEVCQAFSRAETAADTIAMPGDARAALARAIPALEEAAAAAAAGRWDEARSAGGRALWVLDGVLEERLRVEPPPRCGTPLVYDPGNQVIVMFGGHDGRVRRDLGEPGREEGGPGRLNDTWLYDCRTKEWRDASKPGRPPPTLWPKMAFDPASGLVLLVTWDPEPRDDGAPRTVVLWGFDAAKTEWRELDRQAWKGPVFATRHGASLAEIALDARAGLLVLVQEPEEGRGGVLTHVLKLDVTKMAPRTAPIWTAPAPIRPQVVPPDDPAVVAGLKALPANRWVHVHPSGEAADRGWGNAACDPVRGHVYYFGGGHATYQVNDVAIYAPGANRWLVAAGDHNDWIPPAYWDGTCMGLRGGPPAGHQRNYYCAVDGRMYSSTGAESRRWGAESGKLRGRRYSWFYDLDRGGAWRRLPVDVTLGPGVPGAYGKPNLASPDGRVLGFGGALEPYNGRFFPGEIYFSSLDTSRGELTVRKVAPGPERDPNEDRPFCYVAGRNRVFFYEWVGDGNGVRRQGTWVYDVEANRFEDLRPERQPPGSARTVESIGSQDAIYAVIGDGEQWVYSFRRNAWAPLPMESDAEMRFASPYAQVVYSAKYGVLVNVGAHGGGTAVMRPDLSRIAWDGA